MSDVRFIDTTVRDGNQSLWALNMRTDAMLAVAEHIDEAGFESAEFFVTVMFKKLVREQKENAWDWFRLGTQRFKKTPLRLHGGLKLIEKIPVCVFELMIKRIMDYGITLTRTSKLLEQLRRVQQGEDRAQEARHGHGGEPDLLGVAAPYRRVPRAEGPRGRGHRPGADLVQGRGRPADPGARASQKSFLERD